MKRQPVSSTTKSESRIVLNHNFNSLVSPSPKFGKQMAPKHETNKVSEFKKEV